MQLAQAGQVAAQSQRQLQYRLPRRGCTVLHTLAHCSMPKPSHSGAFQDSCLNTCVGTLADAETRQTNSKPRHTKARCPYAEPCSVQALDRSDTPIHHAAKRPAITSAHTPAWHITVSDARIRMLPLPPKPTPRSLPPLQSYSTTPHGIHNHSSTCPQRTENSAFQLSSVLHTHIHTHGYLLVGQSSIHQLLPKAAHTCSQQHFLLEGVKQRNSSRAAPTVDIQGSSWQAAAAQQASDTHTNRATRHLG